MLGELSKGGVGGGRRVVVVVMGGGGGGGGWWWWWWGGWRGGRGVGWWWWVVGGSKEVVEGWCGEGGVPGPCFDSVSVATTQTLLPLYVASQLQVVRRTQSRIDLP